MHAMSFWLMSGLTCRLRKLIKWHTQMYKLLFLSEERVYFSGVPLPFPHESYTMSDILSAAVICFWTLTLGQTVMDALKHPAEPVVGRFNCSAITCTSWLIVKSKKTMWRQGIAHEVQEMPEDCTGPVYYHHCKTICKTMLSIFIYWTLYQIHQTNQLPNSVSKLVSLKDVTYFLRVNCAGFSSDKSLKQAVGAPITYITA